MSKLKLRTLALTFIISLFNSTKTSSNSSIEKEFQEFTIKHQAALQNTTTSTNDYSEEIATTLNAFLCKSIQCHAPQVTQEVLRYRPFYRLKTIDSNECPIWITAIIYQNSQSLSAINQTLQSLDQTQLRNLKNTVSDRNNELLQTPTEVIAFTLELSDNLDMLENILTLKSKLSENKSFHNDHHERNFSLFLCTYFTGLMSTKEISSTIYPWNQRNLSNFISLPKDKTEQIRFNRIRYSPPENSQNIKATLKQRIDLITDNRQSALKKEISKQSEKQEFYKVIQPNNTNLQSEAALTKMNRSRLLKITVPTVALVTGLLFLTLKIKHRK